jgi:Resolvase, N terminal domain
MRTIMAGLAEFERDLIRERVKSGLAAAKARGVALGRQVGQRPSDKKAKTVLKLHKDGHRPQRRLEQEHRDGHRPTAGAEHLTASPWVLSRRLQQSAGYLQRPTARLGASKVPYVKSVSSTEQYFLTQCEWSGALARSRWLLSETGEV